jgi:hypothetical protein
VKKEASCPRNRRMKYFISIILDYRAVEGASCPSSRRLSILNDILECVCILGGFMPQ